MCARMTPVSVLPLDDRAQLAAHVPDARLQEHVRSYWTLVVDEPPAKLRVVPDGHVDLVFDLTRAQAFVAGPRSEPLDVEHDRPTHLLGVTLLPGAATSVLGVPLDALPVDWHPLERVIGPVALAVAARLQQAASSTVRWGLVDAFLLARLGRGDERVERALRAITDSRGQIGIAELGRGSGVSPRNLTRLFHAWVGMSPKRFARIVRAQAALRRLSERPPPELSALAAELGYSDQAHLTREVRAVAGAAPSQLAETFKRKSEFFKSGEGE